MMKDGGTDEKDVGNRRMGRYNARMKQANQYPTCRPPKKGGTKLECVAFKRSETE